MIHGQGVQPRGDRSLAVAGSRGVAKEAVERAVLAEIENLVLAAEIVVEVGWRKIGGHRDVAHAGGGEAHLLKYAGGGGEDLSTPRLGAPLPASS